MSLSGGFIDLHSHTNASDGTLAPSELIALARQIGLSALSITDHDTFDGYQAAQPMARQSGLDLVQGIELNSRLHVESLDSPRHVHMLVYFPNHPPTAGFLEWLDERRLERRVRNRKLVEALQARGVDIALAEVEARGRSLAGRPHFARILVEKGYAKDIEDAFHQYIGEDAPSFVERESATTEEVIQLALRGGGIPVVAHPIRIGLPRALEYAALRRFKNAGLVGLEVIHSDHPPEMQTYYSRLAEELNLLPTGGSDFHGAVKPSIQLGTGKDRNLQVPLAFLTGLRNWKPQDLQ